jgi:hypothetical protein
MDYPLIVTFDCFLINFQINCLTNGREKRISPTLRVDILLFLYSGESLVRTISLDVRETDISGRAWIRSISNITN